MPTSGLRLFMRQGPRAGQTFDVVKPIAVIGREAGNDIVIEDPQVSRHHAKLTLQGGSYVVEDLGSTNGTFMDGRRIMTPTPLLIGGRLGLGDTVVLEVQPGGVGEQPQPVVSPPPAPAFSPPPAYSPTPAYGAPLPAYGAPTSPPPPVEKKGRSCWVWGCGCLVALIVLMIVAAVLLYFFAPPSITGPIIDFFRQFGIELV